MPLAAAFVEGIIALVAAIAPWVAGWFILTNGGKQTPQKGIEQFGSAVTKGPTSVVFEYWLLAGTLTVAAGAGIWYWQSKVAEGRGERLPLPPQQPIGLPPPPAFGSNAGIGFRSGPLHISQGVSSGQSGAPSPGVYAEGGDGGGHRAPRARREIPSRNERRAEKAQSKANLYTAQRREIEARRSLRETGRSGRAQSSGFHS